MKQPSHFKRAAVFVFVFLLNLSYSSGQSASSDFYLDSLTSKVRVEIDNTLQHKERTLVSLDSVHILEFIHLAKKEVYGNPDGAKKLFEALSELSSLRGFTLLYIQSEFGIVAYYWIKGDYLNAIALLKDRMDLVSQAGVDALTANTYINLGILYYDIQDYRSAIEFVSKSFPFIGDNVHKLSDAQNTLGLSYSEIERFDSAIYFLNQSVSNKIQVGYTENIGDPYGNLGLCYQKQQQYDSARYYYLKSLASYKSVEPRNDKGICEDYIHIATLEIEEKQYEKALAYTDSAYLLAKGNGFQQEVLEALDNYWLAYLYTGNLEEAYKSRVMFDSLLAASSPLEVAREFESNKVHFYTFLKRVEEMRKPLPQYLQFKLQHFLLILLLAVVVIISTTIYLVVILKQKRSVKAILDKTEKENDEIQKKLQNTQQKLISVAITSAYETRTYEEVKDKILSLKENTFPDFKEDIVMLKKKVGTKDIAKNGWDGYRILFEASYPSYIQKIKDTFPTLSSSEVRLIVLSLMNLPTKQIADILAVSPNTIKVTRYRIKRKLGLDKESSLDDCLRLQLKQSEANLKPQNAQRLN